MFGLTEEEVSRYIDIAQDYSVQEATPAVLTMARFMAPGTTKGKKVEVDKDFLNSLLADVEKVITLTTINIAYDYAHAQSELELDETEIIQKLHMKFQHYVTTQFIKYGISFSSAIIDQIVCNSIVEMPYLYAEAIGDTNEEFDEDTFLEERLDAYEDYLGEVYEKEFEEEGDYDGEDDEE